MSQSMFLTKGLALSKPHRGNPRRDIWKRKFSFLSATPVGHGGSGRVFEVDKNRVIKVFSADQEGQMDLQRERTIYERLQTDARASKYVVEFEEEWASGLVLERFDSTLRQRLSKLPQSTTSPLASQWVRECCEGLAFLHEKEVYQGDVGCQNIMVNAANQAKFCDFAGSRIGDEKAWISYEVRSQHPGYSGKQPTEQTEIFALGSLIFEVWTCRPPYASDTDSVVREKFSACNFPLSGIAEPAMRKILDGCWNGSFNSVREICEELEPTTENL